MKDLKVQCPNCKRKDFVTTDKYNPDVTPNGSMVKCLLPYHIDWLCSSSTLSAEMTCPECLAPLVQQGVLNVLVPARECGEFFQDGANEAVIEYLEPPPGATEQFKEMSDFIDEAHKKFICDVCGKGCKSQIGLTGHMRSHK